jgi:thioredoxin reductase
VPSATLTGMDTTWDCIVVGAGAAGSSAALVLGRARRRTLVIDSGHQSNLVAEGIGGLLGSDGRPPADFYAAGRDELAAYPAVELRSGEVVGGERHDGGFVLELADGSREAARRVLLATGMDYRFPALPGIAERWGRSAFHCPFCHGWEVRDQPLGVLDRGDTGVKRALLLRFWSDDVTLFTDGPAELDAQDAERLRAAGVAVDERPVAGLRGPGDTLTAVTFDDGGERACRGLLVPVTLHQRSALAEQLGAAAAEPGPVVVDAIDVDPSFHTGVPGLFAAGDVSVQMPSVANAIAAGSSAAAMIVHDLMAEAHGLTPVGAGSGAAR